MQLSGDQIKQLREALEDAFPKMASLERMLLEELGKNLREIAGEGIPLKDIISNLIRTANANGWVEYLVRGACDSNPGNPKLRAIANELLVESQKPADSTTQISLIKDEYYKWLIYECEKFPTQGFNPRRLSYELFVPLKIAVTKIKNANGAIITNNNNTNSIETIWDYIGTKYKSIVIMGAPGSGKTTLLKHLTMEYAKKQNQVFNKNAPDLVPVLITISEVYHKIVANNEYKLPDLIAESASHILKNQLKSQLSKWFENELSQQKFLIMLDGLDEVADESQRQKIIDWLDTNIKEYYKNIFILTSRPDPLQNALFKRVDLFVELQPFNLDDIPTFINKWYDKNKIKSSNKAERLIKQIQNSDLLIKMAVNPLLLTMICTVHDELIDKELPEKPVELYENIFDLLLKKPQVNGISYSVEEKQKILQELALKLMQKNDTKFELSEAQSWIRELLASETSETNDVTSELINYFCECGLLEDKKKQYYFSHLSFQEYLAACQIKKTSQLSLLQKNLAMEWWEETILWYASVGGKNITQQLINSVKSEKIRLFILFKPINPFLLNRLDIYNFYKYYLKVKITTNIIHYYHYYLDIFSLLKKKYIIIYFIDYLDQLERLEKLLEDVKKEML